MLVLASLAATTLTALPLAAPPQGPAEAAAPAVQARESPLLDKNSQESLRKKLQAFLEAQAEYDLATGSKDREKASRAREKKMDAFRKDWESKSKKGNLLASMPDLYAIYENCFTVEKPKNAPGVIRKYDAQVGNDTFAYSLMLPKKYKPALSMPTVIVLPGTKAAGQPGWSEGREYFGATWPKTAAALQTTIFHIPQLPDDLEMDPLPDYSRDGQEAQEQRRIAAVFGTYGQTMNGYNVDRSRLFVDCGRGNSAFGMRFVSMFPDRFAGIVLRHPTPLEDLRLGSLLGIPVLMIQSADNAEAVQNLQKRLEAVSPGSATVVEATDAYPYPASADAIAEWMSKQKRDMTPARVVIEPNHDRFNRAYWARIGRMNPVHGTAAADQPRLEVTSDRANNRIVVKTQGVEDFTLLLNDDIVDLDKEFTVVVNDKAVTELKVRDERGMQRRMLDRRDWEFLFPVLDQQRTEVTAGEAARDSNVGVAPAFAAAGLAGFCLMAAELTAVRLQAPWFGDSAYVWTNVIGVILAALAAGATLGGFLAGRGESARWLLRILLVAGALMALLPFAARPLGQWLLPGELPLDAAMAAIIRGSLVATALLFALPMLLLGAIGPLLVTALARSGVAVGRAAGTVSAAGTLGSLAGTFAATHWLVPSFGCRITMTLTGALLWVAALFVAGRRARVGAAVGTAVLLGAGWLHGGPLREPAPGRELLAERETEYQLLQVVREESPGGPARTLLLINEGLDSFHSIAVADSAFTGAYYDWHAIAPLLAGDGARPRNLRALSIGDAAGSMRAVYAAVHPNATVDGVDIDPETMALGREFFGDAKDSGERFAFDGRVFANRATRRWHVAHVDAYANQIYVPAHLASREFFARLAELLEPGGVVACNVGALRSDDPVLRAIGTTLAATFGHAVAVQVPNSRNYLVVARRGGAPDPQRLQDFTFGEEQLGPADEERWRRIVALAAEPQRWRDVGAGGPILVDDRPVLDELMMQSYVESSDTGTAVACAGSATIESAELAAYEAARGADWLGVLRSVQASRAASAYLREVAGDARWSIRELQSAVAEYRAGLELTDDLTVRARLADKISGLELERQPQQLAAAVAARNGWLALAVGVGFLVLAAAAYKISRMPEAPSVSVLVDAR